MKTDNSDVVIQRVDEWRYAVAVDGLVRYAGSQAECERRAAIFVPKNDRDLDARPWARAPPLATAGLSGPLETTENAHRRISRRGLW